MAENDTDHGKLLELTANIVAAHVSNNHVPGPELPATIEAVYGQLAGLGAPVEQGARRAEARRADQEVGDR